MKKLILDKIIFYTISLIMLLFIDFIASGLSAFYWHLIDFTEGVVLVLVNLIIFNKPTEIKDKYKNEEV